MALGKKPYKIFGDLIGVAMWSTLLWWAYPHWLWWPLAGLIVINVFVLLRDLIKE